MTRVGQILVFLVTALSLLFMGFAVSVYTTRTNWRVKYFDLKKNLDDVSKKRDGLQQQVASLTNDINAAIVKHKQDQEANTAAQKDQQKNYEALLQNFEAAKKEALVSQEQVKTYGNLAKEKSKEVALLRDQLKTTREQREDAVKKQFDTQQAFIELKGSYDTLESRTRDLEQRRGELEAILIGRGIPTDPTEATNARAIEQNAPPVEGIIKRVDSQGKLVEISIGSDDGLRRGHRLHVYRVKPQGRFVCTIEITEVDPDQAVARIVPNLKQGNPQEGDLVATRITASR
jgi:predicted  nucleic acid-binding Zn-ribbon protein